MAASGYVTHLTSDYSTPRSLLSVSLFVIHWRWILFLKGHSQLWDRADLDTSFPSFSQPGIKVHLEIHSTFCIVLLDFLSFSEKPVLSVLCHPVILFLSYLVKNSIYRVSVICKLVMKWYLMRMCASWLCPFKEQGGEDRYVDVRPCRIANGRNVRGLGRVSYIDYIENLQFCNFPPLNASILGKDSQI